MLAERFRAVKEIKNCKFSVKRGLGGIIQLSPEANLRRSIDLFLASAVSPRSEPDGWASVSGGDSLRRTSLFVRRYEVVKIINSASRFALKAAVQEEFSEGTENHAKGRMVVYVV